MSLHGYWQIALVLAVPIAAVLVGRLAWSLGCARTRRGACRIWQFGCRELLVLFTLVSVAFAGLPQLGKVDWYALSLPEWDWHLQYGWGLGPRIPSLVLIAWGVPLVIVSWQFAREWWGDLWRPPPEPQTANLDWLARIDSPPEWPAKRPPRGRHSTNAYEWID